MGCLCVGFGVLRGADCTIVIVLVIAAILFMRGEWQRTADIPGKSWLFLVLSGVATGLSWLCYYRALQLGPVSGVAPIDKLSVVIAILLGVVFLGESLTWPVAIGGLLILAGSLVIIIF
jgi:transporter family protein